ncbi:MAG: tetratricopeptide repeat protein [Porticoccaceae bacterium]|nr:tetratricopeptide repeat protein [Porticoccaceae bacterium]
MADHLSEEEQIEAFKRWWAENGLQTLLSIVLVVGGYFGWQGWQQHQQDQAAEASDLYTEMVKIVSSQAPGERLNVAKRVAVEASADQLKQDFAGSGYAQFAALLKAKLAVDNNELDAAATDLQWVLDAGPELETERLARLRLARVEAARGNLDTALQMVQGIDPAEMKSAYEEAKGDFYVQQGNTDLAFTAYQAALEANQSTDPTIGSILQLKISQVQPAEQASSEVEAAEGDSQ